MEKRYSYIRYFMMTAVLCLLFITAIPVRAAVSVTFPVTYQQTSARAVVTYVNQLRQAGSWYWNEDNTSKIATGKIDPVTYDYDLEKAAMQRAAEIALYYAHTRPNGSSCDTAYYGEQPARKILLQDISRP